MFEASEMASPTTSGLIPSASAAAAASAEPIGRALIDGAGQLFDGRVAGIARAEACGEASLY